MRAHVTAIALVLLLGSCKRIANAVSFEGEIEMTMTFAPPTSIPSTTIEYEVKGDRIRTATTTLVTAVAITDMTAKKTWTLEPVTKTYTELDLTKVETAMKGATGSKPTTKLVKMGRSDVVAGHSCELYAIEDSATPMHIEACVASGLGFLGFGGMNPFGGGAKDGAWSELLGKGFPLRYRAFDRSGAPTMTMEATRIVKKSLPDTDFQIPPGYTKAP